MLAGRGLERAEGAVTRGDRDGAAVAAAALDLVAASAVLIEARCLREARETVGLVFALDADHAFVGHDGAETHQPSVADRSGLEDSHRVSVKTGQRVRDCRHDVTRHGHTSLRASALVPSLWHRLQRAW